MSIAQWIKIKSGKLRYLVQCQPKNRLTIKTGIPVPTKMEPKSPACPSAPWAKKNRLGRCQAVKRIPETRMARVGFQIFSSLVCRNPLKNSSSGRPAIKKGSNTAKDIRTGLSGKVGRFSEIWVRWPTLRKKPNATKKNPLIHVEKVGWRPSSKLL